MALYYFQSLEEDSKVFGPLAAYLQQSCFIRSSD